MGFRLRGYRKRRTTRRPTTKRSMARKAVAKAKTKSLVRLIRKVNLRQSETKKLQTNVCNNQVLEHNELWVIENNIFATVQGTDHHQRIGDTIFGKYMKFKMYFENQQYRPLCYYLVLVLRDKTNNGRNIATGEDIFEGVHSNKSLDYIDYNKYQVLYAKRIRVGTMSLAPASRNAMNPAGYPDGTAQLAGYEPVTQNVSRYHSFTLRINKNIKYLDGNTNNTGTMNYTLAVIPYNNYMTTTSGGTYPIGHVSCVSEFVFKDV